VARGCGSTRSSDDDAVAAAIRSTSGTWGDGAVPDPARVLQRQPAPQQVVRDRRRRSVEDGDHVE
jgi:hypothetical protein